jgi:four helix bundle protein
MVDISGGGKIQSYRDLNVWQKSVDLVVESYKLAEQLPANEKYGLASQIQRAAVSVPADIAEGFGRRGLGEYVHHLGVANGSLKELETHFLIGERLGYFSQEQVSAFLDHSEEIGRMLAGLMNKLIAKQQA